MIPVFLMFAALLFAPLDAQAHDSRPVSVDLREVAPKIYSVNFAVPPSIVTTNYPSIGLNCPRQEGLYHCAAVATPRLVFDYPEGNPALTALVKFKPIAGQQEVIVIPPQQSQWALTALPTIGANVKRYGELGIFHILSGYDHLLFICLLCFIARRRLILTVTGFTLAHSVTLALASLGVVRLSVPAVEATIALSIIFMAAEVIRDKRDSLLWRYPLAISSGFGLLHGFGFASVLSEIGLPQGQSAIALVAFNVGVEIGQIIFIALLLVLARLVTAINLPRPSMPRIAWATGTLAAFWMWQRLVLIL